MPTPATDSPPDPGKTVGLFATEPDDRQPTAQGIGEVQGGLTIPETLASGARTGETAVDLAARTPPAPSVEPWSGPGSWATLEANGQLQPGQVVFGRYLVLGPLGRGGMGSVWLVRHTEFDAERALKMIGAGAALDPQARARFRREAKAMARFTHPNAVTIYDARLTESDVAFIVMEYVPGKSLDKVFRRGEPRALDWTARILSQLCDVLQVAHDHGIVHRDLKPSNLMIVDGRPEGQELLKVLDFGIAKIFGAEDLTGDAHTLTGAFMGTPPYTAPEQADGHADARSDLYSVGVILYEFLTGFRPFTGQIARLISDTIHKPPPPFLEVNPAVEVPPAVERVVLRCLAKDPRERPQSARELAEEFRRAMPFAASTAPGPPAIATPDVRRPGHRAWAVTTVALFVLGILGIALRPWEMRSAAPPGPGPARPGKTFANPTNGDARAAHPPLPSGYRAESWDDTVGGWPKVLVREDGVRFIRLPGSDDFRMGGIGAVAGDGNTPPARPMAIEGYYLQEAEVTNGEMMAYFRERTRGEPPSEWATAYRLLTEKNQLDPSEAGRHPAVGMTHDMAEDYAAFVHGRLPSEAEWEYAARSLGKPNRPYVWPGESPPEMDDPRANIDSQGKPGPATTPGKSYNTDRTDQGIFDLAGDVREWCRDRVETRLKGSDGPSYVVRGGSWHQPADLVSTTARQVLSGDEALDDLGFRVVLDWPPRNP